VPNRLAEASSPYLLQHADNPVDWRPWGPEAFAEARERDVPVFLSIGYATCHWCHVMAHESFEDEAIAAELNDGFVCIKVDREERPDVDAVHMRVLQSLTGQGGWPMSLFLTPDGVPFFAGTYWPREPRHGMPDFPRVLAAVRETFERRRDEVSATAEQIAAAIAAPREDEPAGTLDPAVVDEGVELVLRGAWDREHGGFGRAPKFPQAMTIEWLLHHHQRTGDPEARTAAVQALDVMARGGINDLLAGGFARYSTDERWLVPHFEKMLYDNALLLAAYAQAAALTDDAALERTARETAEFLLGELRLADGAFASAIDADSEGVEGRFSVWSHDELTEVITAAGGESELFTAFLGATGHGNFEGANILHEPVARERFARDRGRDPEAFAADWARIRATLRERRASRVHPETDDKVLTDVNALAVRGLVIAGRLLNEPGWVDAAAQAAEVLHTRQVVEGRLQHSTRNGVAGAAAFLEDFAGLALADLLLFSASGEVTWFDRGLALAREADERFHDAAAGGWFQTAADAEALLTRPKDAWDNAVPAGTSVMTEVCRLLAAFTGEAHFTTRAEEAMRLFQPGVQRNPVGYGWMARQFEAVAAGPLEVVVVGAPGPPRDALAAVLDARQRPGVVDVVTDAGNGPRPPLLAGRTEVDGAPAAYVCRSMVCQRPVTSPDELAVQLAAHLAH